MNENNVVSPCISVCKSDPISGYCYGCGRTDEEKLFGKMKIQTMIGNLKILRN
jgi:Predicted Fe-S protein